MNLENLIPYIIRSSHGDVFADRTTGKVLRIESKSASELDMIAQFNLDSVPAKDDLAKMGECDILDIGYWCKDGRYEPVAVGWRDEVICLGRGEGGHEKV